MAHDPRWLRDYLVRDVEDPRINIQSTLTRHFLIELLFPARFAELFEQEIRFALAAGWLLRLVQGPAAGAPPAAARFNAILDALLEGGREASDAAGGRLDLPPYLAGMFSSSPDGMDVCASAIIDFLAWRPPDPDPELIWGNPALNTFAQRWSRELAACQGPRLSVVEPACGSANDYRFLVSYGIAPFLSYTGLDLCEKNIRNARAMFPAVDFRVGNAIEIDAPDKSFDVGFVHDLFEHLSLEAMESASGELCRVARSCLCLHFFNMHDGGEHLVKPVEGYHWNMLSAPGMAEVFAARGGASEIFRIDAFLRERYACADTHNKNAYTFLVTLQA